MILSLSTLLFFNIKGTAIAAATAGTPRPIGSHIASNRRFFFFFLVHFVGYLP